MSSNVIQFRPRTQPQQPSEAADPGAASRLSEEFLKQAVALHISGEAGADIYKGMIMAICRLVCGAEQDPATVEQKLAASHRHMLEAHRALSAAAAG